MFLTFIFENLFPLVFTMLSYRESGFGNRKVAEVGGASEATRACVSMVVRLSRWSQSKAADTAAMIYGTRQGRPRPSLTYAHDEANDSV